MSARILIADDDLAQLELRKAVLESAGHEVDAAFNPPDALRRVGRADAVILDLRFLNAAGEADSREGLRLIRAIRDYGFRVPVIVLSGWPEDLYGTPEEKMVSRVMVKPVPARELLEAVARLLAPGGQGKS